MTQIPNEQKLVLEVRVRRRPRTFIFGLHQHYADAEVRLDSNAVLGKAWSGNTLYERMDEIEKRIDEADLSPLLGCHLTGENTLTVTFDRRTSDEEHIASILTKALSRSKLAEG